MTSEKTAILFVCMGNICRSPTAEGVFRHVVEQAGVSEGFTIESAGTHAYHIGNAPDHRAVAAAAAREISMHGLKARKVSVEDFAAFDHIIAMDRDNLDILLDMQPEESRARLSLMLDHAPSREGQEVPDPYYGGTQGFEHVLDLVSEAAQGLLESLQSK